MLGKLMTVTALALAAASMPAVAAFPDHAVKLIVSNAPGGPVDIMSRMLADQLSKKWGQSVVVENRPGASGIISTNLLAHAKPDGYTLGVVVASTLTIVPHATSSLPFDPLKDLQPITMAARTPFVFVASQDSPIESWSDFVTMSKQKDMSLGSFSVGTAFHLVWEQVARKAGIHALYIPSSNSGKTQNDLVGGLLDAALDAPSSAKGLIDSGRLRALAVTGPTRFAGLPDTPTLKEAGLDYGAQPWIALMAPAGVPDAIIDKIAQDAGDTLRDPEMVRQMQSVGMVPEPGTPGQLADTIASDYAEMGVLVKELDIHLQ